MKESIAILILCSLIVLAYAGAKGGGKQPEQVQCPNIDQLIAERDALLKHEREERAKERREKIVNELRKFIDP